MIEFYAFIDHSGSLEVLPAFGPDNLLNRIDHVNKYIGLFQAEDPDEAQETAQGLLEELGMVQVQIPSQSCRLLIRALKSYKDSMRTEIVVEPSKLSEFHQAGALIDQLKLLLETPV